MIVITYRRVFFGLSAALAALAVGALLIFGLRFGIDFTGGALVEVSYGGVVPGSLEVSGALDAAGFSGYSLRASEQGYILRTAALSEEERAMLETVFSANGSDARVERLTEVGPTIGKELRTKALIALGAVLLAILLFVAFAFRKVSEPVSSWVYGFIALVTLAFDVVVPVGFYAALGHFFDAQVDTLFITAALTILGYSVHDTIVVFDRVRENLRLNKEQNRREDFTLTAGRALNQTIVRSINTSLTTIVALSALFFLGPEATQDFSLTLLVGIAAGTYSSICLATPLLVWVEGRRKDGRTRA
jgi:preprotein translocase subunit SecF